MTAFAPAPDKAGPLELGNKFSYLRGH
jgi:hypothetical protein